MADKCIHRNSVFQVTTGCLLVLHLMFSGVHTQTTTLFKTTTIPYSTTPFWSITIRTTVDPNKITPSTRYTASTLSTTPTTVKTTPTTKPTLTPTPTAAPTPSPTAAPTPSPTPSPTPTPTPSSPTHFQMVVDTRYSELSNLEKITEELKPQLATICGLPPSRISHIVLSEGSDGKLVVSFDVEPSSVPGARTVLSAYSVFSANINTGRTVKVSQTSTKVDKYTDKRWTDDSLCPIRKCTNNNRCWITQQNYSCVCLTCPVTAVGSSSGPLDEISIIVIAVVASVVALAIIIIVVVCILRSNRRKQEKVSEGSQYSNDSSERYHTNFDYAAE